MASQHASGHVDVGMGLVRQAQARVPQPGEPFHVLLLGDFSGRASRGICEPATIASRPVLLVDRDNVDQALARLKVELHLRPMGAAAAASAGLVLRFGELDDFLPDRLYDCLEVFQSLRQLRRRLSDPEAFARFAEALGLGPSGAPARLEPSASHPALPAATKLPPPEDLLETILDGSAAAPDSVSEPARRPWNALVAEIVRPYLIPKADPRQAECMASVDRAAAELMRALLHHPQFQALEGLWRGLDWLTRRLETDEKLKLFVLDVSQLEWAEDLASDDPQRTGLYKVLVERTVQTPGGVPWAVVAAAYTFGPQAEDAGDLGRMARLARLAQAPFVACAGDRLLGCPRLAEHPDPDDWTWQPPEPDRHAWETLRSCPDAPWVGLAIPRFLLRLPYGPNTAPMERFAFDEMPGTPRHEDYLWGPSSFACALLLAQAFSQSGWSMQPGEVRDIDGLPLHTFSVESERCVTPCAEVLWSDRAAAAVLQRGLMPLRSYANRDSIRLERFQSLAMPQAPLAGRWSHST